MTARVVTIFGGSGFIGRYLVKRLAKTGAVIRVGVRNAERAKFLKPLGDVGQIYPFTVDLGNPAEIAAGVAGADAVVNLVGVLYERGHASFQRVHVVAAGRIAAAAKAAGAGTLVHVSALGADPQSPSRYQRSKADGETAVRAAFPEAVILRPSVVFGPEDGFFNRFAKMARMMPLMPLIGEGVTRFQPVYVGDVADALMRSLEGGDAAGRTFELAGPKVYTLVEIMELIFAEMGQRRPYMNLPFFLARLQASVLELLPVPPLTRDQVTMLEQDNVLTGNAPGLQDLGIEATAAEIILPTYLDRFRPGGRFKAAHRA
jgi:NADH dehydrogenase